MYPAKFEYVAAGTLDEAVSLLREHDGDAKILAGGHSLLPLMKLRLAQPRLLIDIGRVPGLKYVRMDGEHLAIGAMATYRDVQRSEVARRAAPVLLEAIDLIGDQQVRARGTLAGSLAHADPAGDMPAVALGLGGTVRTVGPNGGRDIDLDEFFVDMLTTMLEPDEVIREVRIPHLEAGTGAAYEKFDQPASHYALAGVCAVVTIGDGNVVRSARIAVTGVGPKAYRARGVEQALENQRATEDTAMAASHTAADGVDVQGDIHAGPEYRAHLARVMARRAIVRAIERARQGT